MCIRDSCSPVMAIGVRNDPDVRDERKFRVVGQRKVHQLVSGDFL